MDKHQIESVLSCVSASYVYLSLLFKIYFKLVYLLELIYVHHLPASAGRG